MLYTQKIIQSLLSLELTMCLMESKQCPKCLSVDQDSTAPKIPAEKRESVMQEYGRTANLGCPNVLWNMTLVNWEYNGKTKKYTLVWVCQDCKSKATERNMNEYYFEHAVKIGSHTVIKI